MKGVRLNARVIPPPLGGGTHWLGNLPDFVRYRRVPSVPRRLVSSLPPAVSAAGRNQRGYFAFELSNAMPGLLNSTWLWYVAYSLTIAPSGPARWKCQDSGSLRA